VHERDRVAGGHPPPVSHLELRVTAGEVWPPLAERYDHGMESRTAATGVSPANEEAIEAWNGVLFDRFVQFRDILTTGLGAHGEEALRIHPPKAGDRVLDIGCGFGDTSQRIAALVGPEGSVLGVDAAERFIETAREEAEAAGLANVRFEVSDVEMADFDERFDYAFSRFGTMFFANPVAALRNVRLSLGPGGRLCMVVWRRKLDNEWLYRAEQVVERFVEEEEDSDEPTCGPGPFSMADADVTSQIVLNAGFEDVSLRRCDFPFTFGRSLDGGVDLVMALGPAGEVLRLAGEQATQLAPQIRAALKDELSEFEESDGVRATSSTWIVAGHAPS
jgi:ubiquinone/menaquinone biosynthesis C-methylase UbiE